MSVIEESAVAKWSQYIHKVAQGDESALWTPVEGEDLEEIIKHELTDEEVNDLLWIEGARLALEQTKRSSFPSELFPMGTYIALSQIEAFVAWPDKICAIEDVIRAEDITAPTRARPGMTSDLWIWTVADFTLSGRELLIELGEIGPNDRLDDVRTCVDFWRRLALARRGDGTFDNTDAGLTNRYLAEDSVQRLIADAKPIEETGRAVFQRLNATLAGYAFLLFTDSRCAICDSGPYPVDEDRVMIVRDYLRLGTGHGYEWTDNLEVPHESYTIAMIVDRSKFSMLEINDWGTTFSDPQLYEVLTDVAVIANAATDWENIAPERYAELTSDFSMVHMELYRTFAGMTMEERAFAAARMYGWGLRPFTDAAGVTDQMDWDLAPGTMKFYPEPLGDTDKAMGLYASIMPRPSAYTRFG